MATFPVQYNEEVIAALKRQNPTWQQTMLRVKDPVASVKFYTENFGMTNCAEFHFDSFSLYFLLMWNWILRLTSQCWRLYVILL